MRETLRHEVVSFLREHGASTPTAIALGVCARRLDVDALLSSGGFERVSAPEGRSTRGKFWNLSEVVPMRRGGKSRAELMLDVLRDGKWHTRHDIFNETGRYFLTNNAAAELRRSGYSIEFGWADGRVPQYRLTRAAAAALTTPRVATVSGVVAAA